MLATTHMCGELLTIFAPNSVLLKLERDPRWELGELMEYDHGGIYDASTGDMINSELIEHLKQFGIYCTDVSNCIDKENYKEILKNIK